MGKLDNKPFITPGEWKQMGGFAPSAPTTTPRRTFALPLDHCALSLQPFTTPVCDPSGAVYDLDRLTAYFAEHGQRNPVTGAPLLLADLTRLHFARDADGALVDPMTRKPLTGHTHVVAIKTSGWVYAMDTLKRLALDPKTHRDCVTDAPFKPTTDIITINDPHNMSGRPLPRTNVGAADSTAVAAPASAATAASARSKHAHNGSSSAGAGADADDDIGPQTKRPAPAAVPPAAATPISTGVASRYSSGLAAASLTSTAVTPATSTAARAMTPTELRAAVYTRVRQTGQMQAGKGGCKAYARLGTNLGMLTLELHADWAPQASHNFLELGRRGYYTNTRFHRLVRGFMLQGGDPTGRGTGGQAAFADGKPFADEFHPKAKHDARGVLAMANSGPNTNKSQFYLTFAPAPHLDGRHTVFGRVIDGLSVLDAAEAIPTPERGGTAAQTEAVKRSGVHMSSATPLEPVLVTAFTVLLDPFAEAEADIKAGRPVGSKSKPTSAVGVVSGGSTAATASAPVVGTSIGVGSGALVAPAASPLKAPEAGANTAAATVGKYLARPVAPGNAVASAAARSAAGGAVGAMVGRAPVASAPAVAAPAARASGAPVAARGATSFAALKAAAAAAKQNQG